MKTPFLASLCDGLALVTESFDVSAGKEDAAKRTANRGVSEPTVLAMNRHMKNWPPETLRKEGFVPR